MINIAIILCFFINIIETINANINVLLMIADDMQEKPINFLNLPNLNELINHSNVYENAYVQYPVCGPSRSSIFTGMYPDSIMNYNFLKKVNDEMTIPKFFSKNNYITASIGKTFHRPVENGVDIYSNHWTYKENNKSYLVYDEKENGSCFGMVFCKKNEKELADYKITSKAIELINKFDKPWFISIGFRRPHLDIANPLNLNYDKIIELPNKTFLVSETNLNYFGYCDDLKTSKMKFGKTIQPLMNKNRKKPRDILEKYPNTVDKFLREYYISYMFIDKQIGRIINHLKQTNKWNNTIIVFTSDHGWNTGEHGFWCKNSLIKNTVKVPLIIKTLKNEKKIIKELVETIDIFPTLIKLTKLESVILNGTDISLNGHDYAFSQYARCEEYGNIQKHTCTFGTCDTLPTIKWMGYSVRNGIYSFTGWWKYEESRTCVQNYPVLNKNSKVNWKLEPVDTLLTKNDIVITNDKLSNFYKQIIINKFK